MELFYDSETAVAWALSLSICAPLFRICLTLKHLLGRPSTLSFSANNEKPFQWSFRNAWACYLMLEVSKYELWCIQMSLKTTSKIAMLIWVRLWCILKVLLLNQSMLNVSKLRLLEDYYKNVFVQIQRLLSKLFSGL